MAKLVSGVRTVTVSSVRVNTKTKFRTTDGKLYSTAAVANMKQASLNRRNKSSAIRSFLLANGVATGPNGYQFSPAMLAAKLSSPRFVAGLQRVAQA